MRIACLVPESERGDLASEARSAPASGGYLYDARVAEELRRLGHDVEEIATPRGPAFDELGSWLTRLSAFDVLLQDELGYATYTALNDQLRRVAKRTKRVALVHVPEALLDPSRGSVGAERAYLQSVDGTIFVSASTRADTAAVVGALGPSFVARPGNDHLSHALAEPSGAFHVVVVGNLHPHKGSSDLASVFEQLAEVEGPPWRATVIGASSETPYGAEIAARVRASEAFGGHVTFTGRLEHEAIAGVLASAHVFLSTSRYESWGIAAAEALACGVPVVGYARGGFRELVRNGETGIVVDEPGDVVGLAGALASLRADDARRTKMATRARASALALPSWRTTAEEVARALTSIVEPPNTRGGEHDAW